MTTDPKNVVADDAVTCEIGLQVAEQFQKYKDSRADTDRLLLECLRQRKGEYDPVEVAGFGSVKTFVNVTSTKCRAGEAWLDDVLASTRDRPWTIEHTAIPDLPAGAREAIIQKIKQELEQMGIPVTEAENYVRTRASELRDIAASYANEKAQQGVDRMTTKIQDQLTDADFAGAFSAFRSDLMTYPYAVLKGPVVRNKKVLRWKGAAKTPEVVIEAQLAVERVSPFDIYWASWATHPQDGSIIELMRMQPKSLYNCIGLAFFNDDKLREVLDKYEGVGYQEEIASRSQREAIEQNTHLYIKPDTLDVLDYWGPVKGKHLIEWGVKGIVDSDEIYEVNAWCIDGVCIRALLNPDPLGKRPYNITSYEKVPGSLVGKCPPMLMKPHQEIINSSYRALRRNLGLASGPFAEVDQTRIDGDGAPEEILPGMVKLVTPDLTGSGAPAYKFHNIESRASELLAVINNESRACDDATGIPAYSYGNAGASGAGRTVGGLAMLMGNASKGIKKVIGHIERDVIEPIIQGFYNYNMLFDTDHAIKVDAQVIARGPTGIIMREAQVQRRLEALQIATPYAQNQMIPKTGIEYLLREVFKGLDLEVDKIIPDPDKAKQLTEVAQNIQGMGGGVGNPELPFTPEQLDGSTPQPAGQGQAPMQTPKVGGGTAAIPVVDGRSGAAAATLQEMG